MLRVSLLPYVFGACASVIVAAVIPTVAYIGLVIFSGDLGGPLNFIIIPVVGAGIGFICSVIFASIVRMFGKSSRVLVALPIGTFVAILMLSAVAAATNPSPRAAVAIGISAGLAFRIGCSSAAFTVAFRLGTLVGRRDTVNAAHGLVHETPE